MQTANAEKPIRILLVDDHQSFMDGLAMVINSQSPRMVVIGSVAAKHQAIDAAAKLKPDLIILDLDLGGISGLDIIPQLIENSKSRVLVLTGAVDPAIHEEALVKGASGLLLKDEPAKTILKAIERVSDNEIWAANDTLARVINRLHNGGNGKLTELEKRIASLTAREREIVHALVEFESSTNSDISAQLCISPSTLKNHLTTIFHKLEVSNRVQLIKFALSNQLANPPRS